MKVCSKVGLIAALAVAGIFPYQFASANTIVTMGGACVNHGFGAPPSSGLQNQDGLLLNNTGGVTYVAACHTPMVLRTEGTTMAAFVSIYAPSTGGSNVCNSQVRTRAGSMIRAAAVVMGPSWTVGRSLGSTIVSPGDAHMVVCSMSPGSILANTTVIY